MMHIVRRTFLNRGIDADFRESLLRRLVHFVSVADNGIIGIHLRQSWTLLSRRIE